MTRGHICTNRGLRTLGKRRTQAAGDL